jgi:hypothetical protein
MPVAFNVLEPVVSWISMFAKLINKTFKDHLLSSLFWARLFSSEVRMG